MSLLFLGLILGATIGNTIVNIIKNEQIMADLTKLQASADANKAAVAAVIAFIATLSASDQPGVDAIQAEVDASTASLNAILPAPPAPAP